MISYRIKDVARINRHTLPEDTDPDYKFRYIDISAVGGPGDVSVPDSDTTFSSAPSRARRVAPPGSILVSTVRTYLRAIATVPEHESNLVFSTGFAILEAGQQVDSRFLGHYCLSQPFIDGVVSRSTGVSYPAINPSEIGNLPISLPLLDEQRRIANFLDAETARINHLLRMIERQRRLVNEREEVALPLTISGALLGDGAVATGVPWLPSMHPQAQLVPLVRILQLQRGVDLPETQRVDGPVPVITTAGASGWHDRAIMSGPGVVIRRYGSRGNVHWVEGDYWPHNTTLYVKNFNNNDPRYCYHILRALPYEMEQARSAIPGVNRNDLHRRHVALLPSDLQRRVANALDLSMEKFTQTRKRIERSKRLLNERRQALITAAVTGQFDVSTASGRNVTDGVHR
ncbi:restriction endonuclease subunit S [Streptomyces sp. NPDC014735]|uniref:restriction endonuclease subunit S n=1 Tax=unclassified Streptomyces TaxID=2593676 RepID=UPI0036FA5F3A